MSTIADLESADNKVKDVEIRFKDLKVQLENIEREIAHLSFHEARISRNVSFLKRRGIIVNANEYRKIKEEYSQIDARLKLLTAEKEICSKICSLSEKELDIARDLYAEVFKALGNNVIKGNFGKK